MNESIDTSNKLAHNFIEQATVAQAILIYFEYFDNARLIESKIAELVSNEVVALQLFLFIPTGFCREIVPEVNYSDIFIMTENKVETEYKFSESAVFQAILKCMRSNWVTYGKLDFQKILLHSNEYMAIKAAMKNGQGLHGMQTIPSRIIKND